MSQPHDPSVPVGEMNVPEAVIIDILPFFGMRGEINNPEPYGSLQPGAEVAVTFTMQEDDESHPHDETVGLSLIVVEPGTVDFYALQLEAGVAPNVSPTPPGLPPNYLYEARILHSTVELDSHMGFGILIPDGVIGLICLNPVDKGLVERHWRASLWLHAGESDL